MSRAHDGETVVGSQRGAGSTDEDDVSWSSTSEDEAEGQLPGTNSTEKSVRIEAPLQQAGGEERGEEQSVCASSTNTARAMGENMAGNDG